jgi:transposase
MQRYIGLDVHAASTTLSIVGPTGRRVRTQVLDTTAKSLIGAIKSIAGEKHICMEEGTQSAWLYEILAPHAERVVVTKVTESRGQKNDARDAFGLAEQLRTGAIKIQVFKDRGSFGVLRELSRAHMMVVNDLVRVKNRIKSLYRSRGVATVGSTVYGTTTREAWLRKLPTPMHGAASTLYEELDALSEIRDKAEKELVAEARKHAVAKVLTTCPGLGPIRVAQLLPIVVAPHRFRTKRQFWSYCGLGIVMRSSSDWVKNQSGQWARMQTQQTRGLTLNHNRTLKYIFKGAATTVIQQYTNEPLHHDYQRMLTAGTKPNLAKLSLARKIAAIVLAMWKTQEEYEPTKYTKQDLQLVSNA